ncbi:MAG: hypothetical protein L0387_39340 [Acidobacteria bacterium]|nr:hypothetical protein [Acidobacteriota bacterium]
MIRLKRNIRLLAVFLLLAGAAVLWLTPAGTVVADNMRPLLVQIINDGTSPVPITGTTSISGTADVNVVSLPAVQAQQSGSWNVGIAGTPSVNVANQPTVNAHILSGAFVGIDPANNTVQLANSAGTPFQTTLEAAVGVPTMQPSSLNVPVNKRLIIEFVSGFCRPVTATDSMRAEVGLFTTSSGVGASHALPMAQPFSFTQSFAESTRIYADPGTTVGFGLGVIAGGASAFLSCSATISGLLVDP